MNCKIENCNKEVWNKLSSTCQMHYTRLRRNGTYEKIHRRKLALVSSEGYIALYWPGHILSSSNGYVYEHRAALYSIIGGGEHSCDICGKLWAWRGRLDHVDHINGDKKDNKPQNLRPLCNRCNRLSGFSKPSRPALLLEIDGVKKTPREWSNVDGSSDYSTIYKRLKRGLDHKYCVFGKYREVPDKKITITIDGISKNPNAWSKTDGVKVSCSTILRRWNKGLSGYDCVYGERYK